MNDTKAAPILYADDDAAAFKYFQHAIGALAPVLTAVSVEEGKQLLDAHDNTITVLVSDQACPTDMVLNCTLTRASATPHIVRIPTSAYSELEQTAQAVHERQISPLYSKALGNRRAAHGAQASARPDQDPGQGPLPRRSAPHPRRPARQSLACRRQADWIEQL